MTRASEAKPGEILYNGVELPDLPDREPEAIREGEVMAVPYLDSPPCVIPI